LFNLSIHICCVVVVEEDKEEEEELCPRELMFKGKRAAVIDSIINNSNDGNNITEEGNVNLSNIN
jgi:hypothetical protein